MIAWLKSLFRKGFNISWSWRFGGNNDRKEKQHSKSDRPSSVEIVAVRNIKTWEDRKEDKKE